MFFLLDLVGDFGRIAGVYVDGNPGLGLEALHQDVEHLRVLRPVKRQVIGLSETATVEAARVRASTIPRYPAASPIAEIGDRMTFISRLKNGTSAVSLRLPDSLDQVKIAYWNCSNFRPVPRCRVC